MAQRSTSCSDRFRSAQVPAVAGKLFQNIFPVMLRNLLHVSPLYLLTTSLIWGQHCPLAEITLSLPWGFTWAIYGKQSISWPFPAFPSPNKTIPASAALPACPTPSSAPAPSSSSQGRALPSPPWIFSSFIPFMQPLFPFPFMNFHHSSLCHLSLSHFQATSGTGGGDSSGTNTLFGVSYCHNNFISLIYA